MDNKSDLWGLVAELKKITLGAFITIILVVIAFVVYLITSDNSSTIDATGVYNLVDSKGNVIATDLTPEDIETLMEILNGKSEGY